MTERAKLVVGADGRYSVVAAAVAARTVQRAAAAARGLLHLLARSSDGRAVRNLHSRSPRIRRGADARRFDAHGRRMAPCGIRGQQKGRRGQFPEDVRARAGVRGTRARRRTRAAPFAGAAVPNFFRKPYGPGWALGRRCGLQQGSDHGPGHHRRVPRRRALCGRGRPDLHRRSPVRRCDGRVSAHARSTSAADVRVHVPAGDARTPAACRCSSCSAQSTAISRRWTALPR